MIKIFYVIEDLDKKLGDENKFFIISDENVIRTMRMGWNHYKFIQPCRSRKEALELCSKLRKDSYTSERVMSLFQSYNNFINKNIGGM